MADITKLITTSITYHINHTAILKDCTVIDIGRLGKKSQCAKVSSVTKHKIDIVGTNWKYVHKHDIM